MLSLLFFGFLIIVFALLSYLGITYTNFTVLFIDLTVILAYLIGTGLYKRLIKSFKLASKKIPLHNELELDEALNTIKTTQFLIVATGILGLILGVFPLMLSELPIIDTTPYYAFTCISMTYVAFGIFFMNLVKTKLQKLT